FVIKKLNINPEETIFIDDREKNVKVAQSLGIKGIIFKNKNQLIKDFNNLGVKIND
ncbi:HAD family phosphatase, partial [bacterium]|nr:HAD family phosphatase [bacterium]